MCYCLHLRECNCCLNYCAQERIFLKSCLSLCLKANITKFPQHDLSLCVYSFTVVADQDQHTGVCDLGTKSKVMGKRGIRQIREKMTPAVAEVQGSAHTSQGCLAELCLSVQMCLSTKTIVCVYVYVCAQIACDCGEVSVTLKVHMQLLLPLRHHGRHQL